MVSLLVKPLFFLENYNVPIPPIKLATESPGNQYHLIDSLHTSF